MYEYNTVASHGGKGCQNIRTIMIIIGNNSKIICVMFKQTNNNGTAWYNSGVGRNCSNCNGGGG